MNEINYEDYNSYNDIKNSKVKAFATSNLMLFGLLLAWSIKWDVFSPEEMAPISLLLVTVLVGFSYALIATDLYNFMKQSKNPLIVEIENNKAMFIDGNEQRVMPLDFNKPAQELTKDFLINLREISHKSKTPANGKRLMRLKVSNDVTFKQEQSILQSFKEACYVFKY